MTGLDHGNQVKFSTCSFALKDFTSGTESMRKVSESRLSINHIISQSELPRRRHFGYYLLAFFALQLVLQHLPQYAAISPNALLRRDAETLDSRDLLLLLLICLVACAQCFAIAEPFLIVVLLINLLVIDLPWQFTRLLARARDVHCSMGECEYEPPPSRSLQVVSLMVAVVSLLLDFVTAVACFFELKRTHGRLFTTIRYKLEFRTVLLFLLCSLCGFLCQVPVMLDLLLFRYSSRCTNKPNSARQGPLYEISPKFSYFYTMFLLVIIGVNTKLLSRVLAILSLISTAMLATVTLLARMVVHVVVSVQQREGSDCASGFDITMAVIYGLVLAGSVAVLVLLFLDYRQMTESSENDDKKP